MAKSNPYRSKTNLPTSEYKSDSIFLAIPPALNSRQSLSQSLRRSDFDLQFPLEFRPSLFSAFHLTFFSAFHPYSNWPKNHRKLPNYPFWERKTSKFASPSPQIHSKTPPSVPKPLPFFSRFHLVKSLRCLFNKRGRCNLELFSRLHPFGSNLRRYIATTYRSRISRDSTSRPRRIPSSRPKLPIKRRFCRDSTAHNSISQANPWPIYNVSDRFMSIPYGIAGALMLTGLVFTAWFLLYPAGGGSTLAPVTGILIDASGTRIGADTKLRINIQYDRRVRRFKG